MQEFEWYRMPATDVLGELGVDPYHGLDESTVQQRQKVYANVIQEGKKERPLVMFLRQFTDTMVLVLLTATLISGIVGAMADAVTIMAIVIINAILGFIQEYRAERSLEAIKKMAAPAAKVLRNGKRKSIAAEQLVPGDIVYMEAGDRVPADLRLLETYSLEVDEAALTGESVPVGKDAGRHYEEARPLAERGNQCFMGTSVTRGRASAVVVSTGMSTVMGQIARMMKEEKQSLTPLQARLDQLGKYLIVICLGVCAVVTILGILRGEPIMNMLLSGISLAVAAIPEGLPAIVTVVLAVGVQRMARKKAIVRKLSAVETLGCTTVICSDKTGTLTQNRMTVTRVATLRANVEVAGGQGERSARFLTVRGEVKPLADPDLAILIDIAFNCNNATLEEGGAEVKIQGDPTEGALLVLARRAGWTRTLPRLREIPFDSARKKMSIVVERDGQFFVFLKGAPEVVLECCEQVLIGGHSTRLDSRAREKISGLQSDWGKDALRVLGLAFKPIDARDVEKLSDEELERDLVFAGICGMIDPPRSGVASSVAECQRAGITPIMITGDHPLTAMTIARQLGIAGEGEVISGLIMDDLLDKQLYQQAMQSRVFARVSPEHKNRIVKVLKKHGHVVAMTGDGVNDAPALKAADIGVAMGIMGTEVSREASSMILADDNFSTIVSAVYEGRAIYDNIRKFIRYLLGCNIGEVLVMLIASLMGMPIPLLPIQILWVNLVTDGLPAMALGLEPPEPGIMSRKPRSGNEGIFAHRLGWIISSRGMFIAVVTLAAFIIGFIYGRATGGPGQELVLARTMALTTLVFAQLFYVFECRSERYSPFELGFFANRFLLLAVACSITMHLCVLHIPFFQRVFSTVPLQGWQWGIIIGMCGFSFLIKFIRYSWKRFFVWAPEYDKINF